ncbi:MAG: TolC family protein, partial [Elusimicrobia bacterium]|nr:TolC family protein [Elusimicrobiota bacterium]
NLALSRRFPTVLLGADYGVVGPRFPLKQNNWSATIAIQFPLTYDFWTQYRQKSAEQRQGSLQRVELQDQVRLEVRRAYEKFAFWQSEWPKRQKEWGKAQELFQTARRDFPSNAGALKGILTLLETQVSYLESVREHLFAKATLEKAIGRELK